MSTQYGYFGPLTAEIYPVVWGTPANFNAFRVLAHILVVYVCIVCKIVTWWGGPDGIEAYN